MVKFKIQIMVGSKDVKNSACGIRCSRTLAALNHCQLLYLCSVLSAVRSDHTSCFVFPGDVFLTTNLSWVYHCVGLCECVYLYQRRPSVEQGWYGGRELTVGEKITAGSGRLVPDLTKNSSWCENGSIRPVVNSFGPTLCPPEPGLFLFPAGVNIASAH